MIDLSRRSLRGPGVDDLSRAAGPLLLATVLTVLALIWVQLMVVAVALGRVVPGVGPAGWTVLTAGCAGGALVALVAARTTARALRRRGEPRAIATMLSLVPVAVAAAGQLGSGLLADGPPWLIVLMVTAAVLLAGAVGGRAGAAGDTRRAVPSEATDRSLHQPIEKEPR